MADQSKKTNPQPFNTALFGSSGLTFDLDHPSMISPVSIGPAKKVEDPSQSSGSTPTPPGRQSPSMASKSASKVQSTTPTPVSLFQSPSPSTFEVSHSRPPVTQTPAVSGEPELEVVSLGSSPVSSDPPLIQSSATTLPAMLDPPPPPPHSSTSPPLSTETNMLQPPVDTVPPASLQGSESRDESNPYRLSARPMGRPAQPIGPTPQPTFVGGGIIPPPPMSTGISPPTSTHASPPTQGYSPIMPPPTSGGYQTLPSQTTPPTYYSATKGVYTPIRPHWFFLRKGDYYWMPFTQIDSSRLEQLYQKQLTGSLPTDATVTTDGGRYDVFFVQRRRRAVYWEEGESQVRRCTWFYRGDSDRWYMPYEEELAARLEEEYHVGVTQSMWNRRIPLVNNEVIVMHSATSIVHYPPPPSGQPIDIDEQYTRPKAVQREFSEADQVSQGEQSRVDHLIFVIHGIGPFHDLNFRSIVDCVDDFREVAQLMIQTHRFQKQAPRDGDDGGRVEFLPIHWHAALHSDSQDGGLGVDKQLQPVTLKSIKRLRDFTNETLLDILYYTSPVYAQTIISQVSAEMNRLYDLFIKRNPSFSGGVSVLGHSLGSCIAFDILVHQGLGRCEEDKPSAEEEDQEELPSLETVLSDMGLAEQLAAFKKEQIDYESLVMLSSEDLKELGIPMGPRKKIVELIAREKDNVDRIKKKLKKKKEELSERSTKEQQQKEVIASLEQSGLKMVPYSVSRGRLTGTGQSYVDYPKLNFTPENLFAVGSPIALFLTVRGVDAIGPDFILPTCEHFFNIFHPYDPVAYRIEPLVDMNSAEVKPVLLPHHKGRKRFHLELYDNLGKMSATLKENIVSGMKNMWESLSEFARSHTTGATGLPQEQPDTPTEPSPSREDTPEVCVEEKAYLCGGKLNKGRRIDHVLQEKPIEKLNEYLFALSSHLTYWRSEDTALFMLKQAYKESNPQLIKS